MEELPCITYSLSKIATNKNRNRTYYMANSMNGQDEPNSVL